MPTRQILIILTAFLLSAIVLSARDVRITPVEFNSGADDFASSLTKHNRFIYFTSERDGDRQKVFFVEKTSTGWTSPEEIDGMVNAGLQNGAVTLTPDGQFMIFAAFEYPINGQGRTDLYSARRVSGEWTDIENLGPTVNSDEWDSQPSISSDGLTLYFSSDRPGGYGKSDIWVTRRTPNGWSQPRNLGNRVNSRSDDMSPVIAADNISLYFSSDRPGGEGGFDLYTGKIQGQNVRRVENLGGEINTTADEYFYYSVANSGKAYFSSNRGAEALDIYMAVPDPFPSGDVVMIEGVVRDKENNTPLGARLVVTDLTSGRKIADMYSDDLNGEYTVVLQPGGVYSITAEKPGYLFHSERYEVAPDREGYTLQNDIYLSKVSVRLLVFFDFDKSTLQEESKPELERVIEFLRRNPDVNIKLHGHTDDVGSHDYNQKLSLQRAEAVAEYLISAGIEQSRVAAQGFGMTKPLAEGSSDEARAKNRRVEMIIVK